MDTKKESAAADVPTFKIAHVGNDRKRKKGGGLSFLRSSGTRGVWSGATGSGTTGFAGLGLSLGQMVAVISVMGVIASSAVLMVNRDKRNAKTAAPKKAEVFAKTAPVKIEGDTSSLQGNTNTIPNSLGYLSGSKDGLTDAERAKRDADAAAAAEAQRLADEEAAKKAAEAEKNAAKEPAAVDPMAAAAAAGQGQGQGGGAGLGKKFGSLSSSFGGGGLAGGAGMSGGMNQKFAGTGGGLGRGGSAGRLSAASGASRPKTTSNARSKMGKSSAKGIARKQLNVAGAWSRRAVGAGRAENASVSAGNAFDSNVDAGNAISGPGMAPGAPSNAGASSGANPSTSGGNSGPMNTGAQELCGADGSKVMNPTTGVCEDIKVPEGKSAQETIDTMCTIAMALLVAIAAIALIKAVVDKSFVASAYGPVLGGIMAVMGLIITGLGIAIAAMGDWAQGAVFIGTGGVIASVCMIPGLSDYLTAGTMVITAGAGLVLGWAAKMLDSSHHDKAPEAAQQ